jgi:hypothetical protein
MAFKVKIHGKYQLDLQVFRIHLEFKKKYLLGTLISKKANQLFFQIKRATCLSMFFLPPMFSRLC